MVSVCLPSDALSQHLPSYLGFSYLGRGVSVHGCSSKAQPLLLTLVEITPPDTEHGVAPLGPPAPAQPPFLGHGVAHLSRLPLPWVWGSSSRLVAQSCPTFCHPMDYSTPGFPVFHHLPEFAQTHVHWVDDAIQSSHALSSPSPPALSLSHHQSLFQYISQFLWKSWILNSQSASFKFQNYPLS